MEIGIKKVFISEVHSNEWLTEDVFRIILTLPRGMKPKPGQFVSVKPFGSRHPMLRRPISVSGVKDGKMELLVKKIGEGTSQLSQLETGDKLDVLGPLGNTFKAEENKKIVFIGGGIGIAPLRYLADELNGKGVSYRSYLGFREKAHSHENFKGDTTLSVERDGGRLVTDVFEEDLERNIPDIVYACGPHSMLKKIAEMSRKYGFDSRLSLEEKMACGIGACLGCAVKIRRGDFDFEYQRVCKEGPVFSGKEVIFDE